MTTMSQHELQEIPTGQPTAEEPVEDQQSGDQASINSSSLPPCDHGKAAWRLLCAAFVFEALLWGFPLSFGVFQNYYSQIPEFKNNPFISVVGSIASGISYMAAPIMIPISKRYSHHRKRMILVGWPICLLSLIAGSFAHNLGTLIFTQGVMYGFGFVIFYYPILSMVNEFWVERRGIAYGILCSASGVSGAAFPFAIEQLLNKFGFRVTLRAIAIGLFIFTGPLIPYLKGRLPSTSSSTSTSPRTTWSFLQSPLFWTYNLSNLSMGFGYFFPSLYLPSYASYLGFSPTQGALLLATMSISQVLGQMSFGYASDHYKIDNLAIVSSCIAAICAFTAWGLARRFEVLIVFAIFYGFFGTGYTALWGRMGTRISGDGSAAFVVFGILNFGKGVGNVLSGPIGGGLLRQGGGGGGGGYGTVKYERIVIFTGVCMGLSAAVIVGARVGGLVKRLM